MLVIAPTPDEVWLDVPGWEGRYQVSSIGRVRTVARLVDAMRYRWQRSKILSQQSSRGYPYVLLSKGSQRRPVSVHRLVCLAFHGPAPSPTHEVAHGDGTRNNNRADNLRWATRSENQLDRHLHGQFITSNKIDISTAAEVKARLRAGEMQKTIASDLGISKGIVGHIARGKAWAHVS